MYIPELLKSCFEKPVGIFGHGVSGKAVAQVLENLQIPYAIYDKSGKNFTAEIASTHSLIVYSPGFSSNHPWLGIAKAAGCLCLGELDFAALFWTGKIIAVTGTNGKSTLTCLLAGALNGMAKTALACGNLGSPLSAQYHYFEDPQAIAVCEVSSFQAETIKHFSPDVLIWTTFDVDHLDRHPNLEAYFHAKWNLINHLKIKDFFIGETVLKYAHKYGYSLPPGSTVVSLPDISDDPSSSLGMFSTLPQMENYLLALAYWTSQGFDIEVLNKTAIDFQPLPHRLQKVAEINGITFWNDSKGTNFSATTAALSRFKNPIWIGGGKLKGGDLIAFVDGISPYIQEAFLIGEAKLILEKRLVECHINVQCCLSLEEAIEAAFNRAVLAGEKREIVFSPAFSSFDMFKSAEERGNFFEKKVLELKTAQNTLEIVQAHQ